MSNLYIVSLIGEQPIPNLLPILHIKPDAVLLVRTTFTKKTSLRLEKVLTNHSINVEHLDISDGYNIEQTYTELYEKLADLKWVHDELIINLTGGTKVMSIAAFQYAYHKKLPFIYLQSEGKQSLLRHYNIQSGKSVLHHEEVLPPVINLNDYLSAYLSGYVETGYSENNGVLTNGGKFEKQLHRILQQQFETKVGVKPQGTKDQLEIDFLVRLNNQVGIIEAKTGKSARKKAGIDQLNTAGGREYLGIYTQKFLVVDCEWPEEFELRKLAKARRIEVIELPSYEETGAISADDERKLLQTITEKLGG